MNSLRENVEQSIRARELFQRGQGILVAVSGGLDSMVLLHLLCALSKVNRWKIAVAHFNHQLRGRSSDADERLVERTAARLKLKFVSERADVKKFAREHRLSIEMAARKARHEFLAHTAKKNRLKTIALAHHADDQIELFLLRLLRGAGTEGLSGMKWSSPSPVDSSLTLVRPLLDQPKEALSNFARENKIAFREDVSNVAVEFQRNRIRHEITPRLKQIQPALNETVLRTMEIVGQESDFVLKAASDWLRDKNRIAFDQLHVAVQRVCLRLQLRTLSLSSHFDLIERLRLQPNQVVAVSPQLSLCRDLSGIVHPRATEASLFNEAEIVIDLRKGSEARFAETIFSWSFQNRKGTALSPEPNSECFDALKLGSQIRLRHWKPGDRFQPIGMKSPKKLQDLFTDLKIPRRERHQRIVGVTERGELFWVEGVRISECFKLDKQSRRRLKWHWQYHGDAVAGNT